MDSRKEGLCSRSVQHAVPRYFKDFCLATSQHGLKYLALAGQAPLERVIWLVVLLLATMSALCMMWDSWARSRLNPTLTAIETAHYPVWNTNFPAVSLCSGNQVDKSSALGLARTLRLPAGVSAQQAFLDLQLLNRLILPSKDHLANLTRLQVLLDLNNLTTDTVARKVMPPCDRMLVKCSFKGDLNCLPMFKVVKTAHGYCCGFNYHAIASSRPNLAAGSGKHSGPARISSCGPQTGLVVVIDNMLDEYFSTDLASYGTRVLIHDPVDFPSQSTNEQFVSSSTKALISVYPVNTYPTASVLSVEPKFRRCYDYLEGQLQGTEYYSFENCILECQHNLSVQLCDCSPFFYPRIGNQRICKMTDIPCLAEHMRELQVASTTVQLDQVFDGYDPSYPCGCMPECDQLRYELESSESALIINSSFVTADSMETKLTEDHSIVQVYFIDLVGTRYRRAVIHSWHDVLGTASFGGLLGIFLGFSVLTGFEAVYFFTIRVFFQSLHAARDTATSSADYNRPHSSALTAGVPPPHRAVLGTLLKKHRVAVDPSGRPPPMK